MHMPTPIAFPCFALHDSLKIYRLKIANRHRHVRCACSLSLYGQQRLSVAGPAVNLPIDQQVRTLACGQKIIRVNSALHSFFQDSLISIQLFKFIGLHVRQSPDLAVSRMIAGSKHVVYSVTNGNAAIQMHRILRLTPKYKIKATPTTR